MATYGMNPVDLFEANDLFESGNLTQVQVSLLALAGMVSTGGGGAWDPPAPPWGPPVWGGACGTPQLPLHKEQVGGLGPLSFLTVTPGRPRRKGCRVGWTLA